MSMDLTILQSVATQMMAGDVIQLGEKSIPVRRTSAKRLRSVTFEIGGHAYTAIEQNPEKPSRWGELARNGHKVVQFKDDASQQFVAVSIDGKVREYQRQ